MIRTKGVQSGNPGECLTESNRLLASYSVDCMFLTMFYAIYNVKTGFVDYCNAGHNPPHLLRADGSIEELPRAKNTIVGAFDGIAYKEDTLQIEKGDTLVMFTDGVTEAMNAAFEEYGAERLDSVLAKQAGKDCQQVVEAVKADISDFVNGAEQSDDITMLVIKRK
jgi:sigma-B regulation protein RsbU (phosphoserine phosphatase)